jgi:predicted dehydrogenase
MEIGLIGCGAWGRKILCQLRELDCRVVVFDPSERARRAAIEEGATSVRSQVAGKADGWIIASPASTHASMLAQLADSESPIFVEKPFTTDLASARCYADNPRIFVMHIAYHPAIQLLASLAQDGRVGQVKLVRSTRTNWTSPRTDVDPVWTLAPHDLSLAVEILGEIPRPKAALSEQHQGRPVGLIGICGADPALVFEVSSRFADKRRELRIHGTDGVLSWRDEQPWVELHKGDRSSPQCVTVKCLFRESTSHGLQTFVSVYAADLHRQPRRAKRWPWPRYCWSLVEWLEWPIHCRTRSLAQCLFNFRPRLRQTPESICLRRNNPGPLWPRQI